MKNFNDWLKTSEQEVSISVLSFPIFMPFPWRDEFLFMRKSELKKRKLLLIVLYQRKIFD